MDKRKALIDELKKYHNTMFTCECYEHSIFGLAALMLEADAKGASVVHCLDCKHLMFSDCYGECGAARMGIVKPDDFCSYGERKTV